VADSRDTGALAFVPVLCEQKPAALFREPVDLKRSSAISRSFHQAFVAETKKISMELAAATEGQAASNLPGVMPASVSQRFEHQAFQFSARPHKAILTAFVSTLLFVMGTRKETKQIGETAKACTLQRDSAYEFARTCSRFFLSERFVSNAQKI